MAEFHSLLRINLPSTGVVGDVYYTTDTRELFFCIGNGGLVAFEGLLTGVVGGQVGPQGSPGPEGPQGVPGPKGDTGTLANPTDLGVF